MIFFHIIFWIFKSGVATSNKNGPTTLTIFKPLLFLDVWGKSVVSSNGDQKTGMFQVIWWSLRSLRSQNCKLLTITSLDDGIFSFLLDTFGEPQSRFLIFLGRSYVMNSWFHASKNHLFSVQFIWRCLKTGLIQFYTAILKGVGKPTTPVWTNNYSAKTLAFHLGNT